MLSVNIENVTALEVLGSASEELELYSTAVFAYEAVRKLEPANIENIKSLMKVHIKTGNCEEAIRIGDVAYRANPSDDEVKH